MRQTLTIQVDNELQESLLIYTNAKERDSFITELFNNFRRRYKHLDEEPSLDTIMNDLCELKDKCNVIIDN